jgi:UDP-glucose:(heptosyl)LPS alpha-1,3-glucosyltransferase
VKRDLERWHGVPRDRIAVVPYGVEIQRFERDHRARARLRAELGTPADSLVLLFVGSQFERKGLDLAIAGLARSRIEKAELWVVGGTKRERKRLRRGRLDPRVRLLGPQPAAEMPALYSGADAFVLPTQQDSWAIPVMEALAASCPVVTSEYAGSSDLITHGVDGYLLRGRGHPDELARLLDGPLTDPAMRAVVSGRGLKTITRCDYEHIYADYRAAHHRAYELALERRAVAQTAGRHR